MIGQFFRFYVLRESLYLFSIPMERPWELVKEFDFAT